VRTQLVWIATVALCWGAYPLVMRDAKVSAGLGSVALVLIGLIPVAVAARIQGGGWPRLVGGDVVRLIAAGLMFGIGVVAFNSIATSRRLDASVAIPISDTAMMMVTVVGAIAFFGEPITTRKVIGIALLVAGILTLRPN
jgi:drug/metabolite transporter (DMT)-like permease